MTFSVRLATLAVFASLAIAHNVALAAADAARGQTLAYTCLGCHGIPNYKNAYPSYDVPKLAGQHPEYLIAALKGYKSRERSHATMHAHAWSMSEQDMSDIAAYLSGTPVKSAGTAPVGAAPTAGQVCVSCHGTDGVGITVDYPTLAGQHASYIARALTDYKRGGRKNPIMANFTSQLSAADIEALASYYARQQPSLQTLQRRTTRFAAR
jgi:cytochrome c553